ncbi:MAG: dihydropteroate synthase [Thermodesulfobacteriota bacterium]
MLNIVGERLNTSREPVREAVLRRDAEFVVREARNQAAAGAHFIEVNAGTFGPDEEEHLFWLMDAAARAANRPLAVDSACPETLARALARSQQAGMVNSVSLEKNRFEPVLKAVEGKACHVVALCLSDEGMPRRAAEVVERASKLVAGLESVGIPRDRIHVDPLVQPVATDTKKGLLALDSLRALHSSLPGIHTICGLSNVSFGLPRRRAVNRCFLALLMSAGLTGAILDPLDPALMATVSTAGMLLNRDPYCMGFVKKARAGNVL